MAGNTAAKQHRRLRLHRDERDLSDLVKLYKPEHGRRQYRADQKILLYCLGIVTVIGLVLGQGAYLLGRPLLSIYSSDPAVIDSGIIRLSIVSASYFLCGLMDVSLPGSIRGLGYSIMPMLVSLSGACAFRVLWIFTIFQVEHTLFSLYISYPISWILTFCGASALLCLRVPQADENPARRSSRCGRNRAQIHRWTIREIPTFSLHHFSLFNLRPHKFKMCGFFF